MHAITDYNFSCAAITVSEKRNTKVKCNNCLKWEAILDSAVAMGMFITILEGWTRNLKVQLCKNESVTASTQLYTVSTLPPITYTQYSR